jgi:hypothetical protein
MDDQRIDRTGRMLTHKEWRFARLILVIGCVVFVLSWFRVVNPWVGRIALAVGVFGGGIAKGLDSHEVMPSDKK